MSNGYGDPPPDEPTGGTGPKLKTGAKLLNNGGVLLTVVGYQPDISGVERPMVTYPGLQSAIPLPPGQYLGEDNATYRVGSSGNITIGQAAPGTQATEGVTTRDLGNGVIGVFDSQGNLLETRSAPSGGGGGPQMAGTQAPDPYAAATILFQDYDRQLAQGTMTADQAAADWQREFDLLQANQVASQANIGTQAARDIAQADLGYNYLSLQQNQAEAIETAKRTREIEEAARQVRLQEEAGRRGQTAAGLLGSSLPGLQAMRLPLLGRIPVNRYNMDQLLTQGMTPLAQTAPISQNIAASFPNIGQAPMLPQPGQVPLMNPGSFPSVPRITFPALPNTAPLASAAASGFPGWAF